MAARLTTYLVAAIVATTLIAGLIVGAQRDDSDGPVDLIVHNAAIYTADRDNTRAEAVAIRGNQILRVGREREIMRFQRPQTVVIDAGGASVLPGFNDAHAHVIEGGLRLAGLSLDDAATLEEIQTRIGLWAEANPERSWIAGYGWDPRQLPSVNSTRQQLDAVVADRPVVLVSQDGRSSWVNSAALAIAGITRRSLDPPGGTIVRDAATGEATGVLQGAAMAIVSNRMPRATRGERVRALRAAVAAANANGITSMQNAGSDPEDFAIFEEAQRSGELAVRIYSALTLDGPFTNADRAQLLNLARQYPDDPTLKSGAVAIALDGDLEEHTAAFPAPYWNVRRSGETAMTPDELNRSVRLIDAEGWQVMTDASGERAVRMALNAYEHAARSNRAPERDRRHRVEGAELIDGGEIERFGALGVLASLRPIAGARSGERPWPLRNPAGEARIAFGSDWPAGPLNPLLGIQAAVTSTAPDGLEEGHRNHDRRLALEQAINAYTSSAAWASFDEQRKGTITPGMLADLVVLSGDIFDGPPSDLAGTRVVMTIFDGKVVYRRDRGTN